MKSAKADKTVKLSVVVASLYSPTNLKNCLKSIFADKLDGIEIVVADCCLKENTAEWIEKFPTVEFVEFPAKTSLSKLLGAGIARANGEIIAITDSSCIVANNWASLILQAHKANQSPIIGGSVEISDKRSLTDWTAYFCDYAEFIPPVPNGLVSVVPGNNLSIKREILQNGTEFVEPEFWKTLWCRRLQSEGIELFSEPTISVSWHKTYKLIPFLVRRFHQGRCFAGMRFGEETFSKRVFYAVGSVFLPFVFLFRIAATILQRKRFFGKFLLSLPMIFLAVVCWSIGETIGFLSGAGESCERID